MSRRSNSDTTDSMELLLDTVCNTFGAVIFISMLVAIMVSRSSSAHSSSKPSVDPALETAQILLEIETARDRVRVLGEQLRQQKLLRERFSTDESLALSQSIQHQTNDSVRFLQQKTAAVAEISATNSQRAGLQHQLQQQQAAFESSAAESKTLRQEMERTLETVGRTARIPQVRRTSKESVVFALDDSRLYRITTAGQTVDDTDCDRNLESGMEVLRPKPGGGVPVATNATSTAISAMTRRFDGLSASRHFVQIFVSRDSFAAFLPVKDTLVDLGLEYEVLITEDDSVELFLGQKTRDSFVQ
jgi:hypothetical protein